MIVPDTGSPMLSRENSRKVADIAVDEHTALKRDSFASIWFRHFKDMDTGHSNSVASLVLSHPVYTDSTKVCSIIRILQIEKKSRHHNLEVSWQKEQQTASKQPRTRL